MTGTADAVIADLLAAPEVLGVVLSGSRARAGMAGPHSDHDLYAVLDDAADPDRWFRRDGVADVMPIRRTEFASHALPGSPVEWDRYAFVHARVLKDTGGVAELVSRKAELTDQEAYDTVHGRLDAYVNAAYRWLKNHRAGRATAARLDAAESLQPFLTCLFARERRVRPYHAYLEWELRNHPLRAEAGAPERLLPLLGRVLTHADPADAHLMTRVLEVPARQAGHGDVLDSWGADLALVRGTP